MLTRPVIPVIEPRMNFPRTSRNNICCIVAGAPVLISTTRKPNIFFAGDVDWLNRTMSQISQPIPSVTTKRSPSSKDAPKRWPLLQGDGVPELNEPELKEPEFIDPFDGGGGGGIENGSDI